MTNTCPNCGEPLKKRRLANSTWTDEREETVKRLWKAGASASEIARELGGVTRNSVIGKAHRLGLMGRSVVAKDAASAIKTRRMRKPSAPRTITVPKHPSGFKRSSEKVSRKPKPELPAVVPVLGPVAFVSRPFNRCVWIDGDPKAQPIAELMVCGEAVKPGTNYCPHHHARLHDKYVLPAEAATYRERAA